MAHSVIKMVTDFRRDYGRFNTASNSVIKIPEVIAILNRAKDIYTKEWVKRLEVDSTARKVLRNLEEKEEELEIIESKENYIIAKFPKDFYHLMRQRGKASKEKCGSKEIIVTMFQTDDLNLARKDPFWKSTFAWEHAIGDEGSKGLYIWHEGDFKIDKVIIDYYRKPKDVHAPNMVLPSRQYIYGDGKKITKNQDLELDSEYSNIDIGNIALLNALSITDDANDYALKLKEIIETHQASLI